jgi:hypothetical protein
MKQLRRRYGRASKKLTPLAIARADEARRAVEPWRFSTLRVHQYRELGPTGYWYVGHDVEKPLYPEQPDGPTALFFESVAGPFTSRGAAEKVIERARRRAEKEAP